jgi:hypothetical protein
VMSTFHHHAHHSLLVLPLVRVFCTLFDGGPIAPEVIRLAKTAARFVHHRSKQALGMLVWDDCVHRTMDEVRICGQSGHSFNGGILVHNTAFPVNHKT